MISGIVFSALRNLVNGRCWPNHFMQPDQGPPTWPAIRYTVIASEPTPDIEGTADVLLDDVRVQLDLVDRTYGGVATLRDEVIAVMETLSPPAVRQPSGFETFDVETKTHRVVLEYVFYQSSALTGSP